jgi:tagatose-1,6-bisphosphate aldolase non-catalytic subunit AgaZ/GatZ
MYKKLKSIIKQRRCTLLGVGPMSLNCVDATIELANHFESPLILIASRRQIDSEAFGGGYVNNWTTRNFSNYISERNKKNNIILARDHGGPWQNSLEVLKNLDLKSAMNSAKESYLEDIESGFQIIHLDPSIDIHSNPNIKEVLERLYDLYDFCYTHAQRKNKEIIFEIGTEEQSGSTNSQEELDYTLRSVINFCSKNKFPKPAFVVIQCGTRVMEMQNIGSFDSPIRVANEIPAEIQLPKMIEICNQYDVLMKEHNTDYLSDDALQWHPRLGIHAANVAPEFGVAESKALIKILEENGLTKLAEIFLATAFNSRKWEKWMLTNSKASDRDKAIIAGHYVFSFPEIIEVKNLASVELKKISIDLELFLKNQVKNSILRYMKNFRLVNI